MKHKITMDFLARKLNISKTTISKAINNCPGISPKTKQMIVQTASDYGYIPKVTKYMAHHVSFILPASPEYFWGRLRKCLNACSKETDIKCNNYVYPNLHDDLGALHCINQALSEETSALILAVPDSPEIHKMLEQAANNVLIILIEEFIDIKNTFYIGEDSFYQGYAIGEKYIHAYPNSTRFAILRSTDFYTEKKRIEGFLSAINDYGKKRIADLRENSETRSRAAYIARQLANLKYLPDCIFCPSGNILYAADSIKKLNKNIHCIGFDMHAKRADNDGIITHLLLQDIDSQAKKAWEYTGNFLKTSIFPEDKKTYIDNILEG